VHGCWRAPCGAPAAPSALRVLRLRLQFHGLRPAGATPLAGYGQAPTRAAAWIATTRAHERVLRLLGAAPRGVARLYRVAGRPAGGSGLRGGACQVAPALSTDIFTVWFTVYLLPGLKLSHSEGKKTVFVAVAPPPELAALAPPGGVAQPSRACQSAPQKSSARVRASAGHVVARRRQPGPAAVPGGGFCSPLSTPPSHHREGSPSPHAPLNLADHVGRPCGSSAGGARQAPRPPHQCSPPGTNPSVLKPLLFLCSAATNNLHFTPLQFAIRIRALNDRRPHRPDSREMHHSRGV
jgi:hypothetical protein